MRQPERAAYLANVGSSKTACRERRRAANKKRYKRLEKLGRVPRHSRAERLRAAAERRVKREIERRRREMAETGRGRRVRGRRGSSVRVPARPPRRRLPDTIRNARRSRSITRRPPWQGPTVARSRTRRSPSRRSGRRSTQRAPPARSYGPGRCHRKSGPACSGTARYRPNLFGD